MPTSKASASASPSLAFINSADQARSLLDPLRRSILEVLQEPGSSSSVADHLGLPRQRLNYHVRALEEEGLLRHVEDRRKGNCIERVVQATAPQYVIDPDLFGLTAPEAERLSHTDSPSAVDDLMESSSRTLHQVGRLIAQDPGGTSRLPTLSLEAQISFRSTRDEAEFANAMRNVLDQMTRRYHDPGAPEGRAFRVTIGGHLAIEPPPT